MAALLSEWTAGGVALPTRDRASLALVRERLRALGEKLGLGRAEVERAALCATELGQNQLDHARRGELVLRAVLRGEVPGVEVVAADGGRGLADPDAALRGRDAGPRGGGLPGVFRLADEVDADLRRGEGTCFRARVFREPPDRRSEVGIVGRAMPGIDICGDHASLIRSGDDLLVAVADGLGHGPDAFAASAAAVAAVRAASGQSFSAIFDAVDLALSATRGAVLGLGRIDLASRRLEYAALGDIGARIAHLRRESSLPATPAVLGHRPGGRRRRRLRTEHMSLGEGDLLVVFTDGIKSRWSLADEPLVQRRHPLLVAHQLLERFARDHDDALVLVAR